MVIRIFNIFDSKQAMYTNRGCGSTAEQSKELSSKVKRSMLIDAVNVLQQRGLRPMMTVPTFRASRLIVWPNMHTQAMRSD